MVMKYMLIATFKKNGFIQSSNSVLVLAYLQWATTVDQSEQCTTHSISLTDRLDIDQIFGLANQLANIG